MADDYNFVPGQGYSSEYHKNIISSADSAAKNAYNDSMLKLEGEKVALMKAQQAWKETTDKAGLTGYFEGQATMPTQQWWAQTFGNWGAPTPGQQTLAGQGQEFSQAQALAAMYGTAFTPGGAGPAAGTQTQAAQQQAFTQGLQTQQEQRAAQAQQQSQAQQYLQLLSQLRGPADWAKYQQVLGSTPGGMRDLVAAAMGQYVPGGGATTGMNPQAVSLQSLMGDVSGQPYYGQGGGQLNMPNVYGQNTQGMYQQQAQQNLAALRGQPTMYAGGTPNFNESTGQFNMPPAAGNGTNTMGAPQQQYNLPAPNQIAAQSWKNLTPSQRDMMLGNYEAQGWHKPDVEALMNQSLPKYASNAPTAGTFRLGG